MRYGCAWYPEHWPGDRWAIDLRLMRDAHMNAVRVAEFAWSRIEPEEGRFDLDWLVRAVDLAGEHGIACIVGTPTATPPAWLTARYPDTLGIDGNGKTRVHGNRCHASAASPRYREFCRKIVAAMAQRLGPHANVIGWQIDNEFGNETFDPFAAERWQQWLKARYGTLDRLNDAWSTAYWSQTYFDFSHVPMGTWTHHNPCLASEFKRFTTALFCDFQAEQVREIRRHASPGQWITHNAHAADNLDFGAIFADLDIAAYDYYVGYHALDPAAAGFANAMTRGFSGTADKPRGHWILECQPNHVIFGDVPIHLDPGEIRRMVWGFVGQGADGVLLWQWRAALGSHEQYWGNIIAPDGTPRPVYRELQQIGKELADVAPLLHGTVPTPNRVAILHTYRDRWVLLNSKHHQGYDPRKVNEQWFGVLRRLGLDVDVIDPTLRPIDGYAAVFAPTLHLLDDALADRLAGYVDGGGHLVLGPRSGMKDEHGALLASRQPGNALSRRLGATVSEFYPIRGKQPVKGDVGEGVAETWCETLDVHAADAQILLRYGQDPGGTPGQGWLPGQPAAVSRQAGRGRIAYVGALIDGRLLHQVCASVLSAAGVLLTPRPEAMEVSHRPTADGRTLRVAINHGQAPAERPAPAGRPIVPSEVGVGPLRAGGVAVDLV